MTSTQTMGYGEFKLVIWYSPENFCICSTPSDEGAEQTLKR